MFSDILILYFINNKIGMYKNVHIKKCTFKYKNPGSEHGDFTKIKGAKNVLDKGTTIGRMTERY